MKSGVFMKIQESGENYLENILLLEHSKSKDIPIRSVDIANEMGFSRASVSRAMSLLKNLGHIEIGLLNQIILTDTGRQIASEIYEKHCILRDFLMSLGVNKNIASEDACKMEHIISRETFDALKNYINNK